MAALGAEEMREVLERTLVERYEGTPSSENAAQMERDKVYVLSRAGFKDSLPRFQVDWRNEAGRVSGVSVSLWTREKLLRSLDAVAAGHLPKGEARAEAVRSLLGYVGDAEVSERFDALSQRYFSVIEGRPPRPSQSALYCVSADGVSKKYVLAPSMADALGACGDVLEAVLVAGGERVLEVGSGGSRSLYCVAYEDGYTCYCLAGSPGEAVGVAGDAAKLQNRAAVSVKMFARSEDIVLTT